MEKKWWQYFNVCFELMSFLSYSKLQAVGMATSGRQLRFAPISQPNGGKGQKQKEDKNKVSFSFFKLMPDFSPVSQTKCRIWPMRSRLVAR